METQMPCKKILLVSGLIASALIIGVWIWKSVQISNERKQATMEMQLLKEKALLQIRYADELHLKSIAKPIVWAIRTEMLKNNISQVSLYVNELVKEKNFIKIVILDDQGVVVLSTNKKEEGKELPSTGKANYLLADITAVENINDSLTIMSSPIMGFNTRLGTLIINYSVDYRPLN